MASLVQLLYGQERRGAIVAEVVDDLIQIACSFVKQRKSRYAPGLRQSRFIRQMSDSFNQAGATKDRNNTRYSGQSITCSNNATPTCRPSTCSPVPHSSDDALLHLDRSVLSNHIGNERVECSVSVIRCFSPDCAAIVPEERYRHVTVRSDASRSSHPESCRVVGSGGSAVGVGRGAIG